MRLNRSIVITKLRKSCSPDRDHRACRLIAILKPFRAYGAYCECEAEEEEYRGTIRRQVMRSITGQTFAKIEATWTRSHRNLELIKAFKRRNRFALTNISGKLKGLGKKIQYP